MNAAYGIVLKDKRILLTERKDVPVWVLPGGGVEWNETPQNGCLREVLEETGIEAKVVRHALSLKPVNRLGDKTDVFICEPVKGTLMITEEVRSVGWFSLDDLPQELFFAHKKWIDEALSAKNLIERNLDEINYKNLALYILRRPWHVFRFFLTRMIHS